MEQNFHWIQGIQRIWEITEAWIGFSFRIYSVTCLSVEQWYHLYLLHRRSWVLILQSSFWFLIIVFCHGIQKIRWKHLEKTPVSPIKVAGGGGWGSQSWLGIEPTGTSYSTLAEGVPSWIPPSQLILLPQRTGCILLPAYPSISWDRDSPVDITTFSP